MYVWPIKYKIDFPNACYLRKQSWLFAPPLLHALLSLIFCIPELPAAMLLPGKVACGGKKIQAQMNDGF